MDVHYSEPEQFVKTFLTQLSHGAFSAGERLPTESELAEQYGIGKTNVHLAIQKLARLGFLRVVPRHAIYISDPKDNLTLEALDAMFYYLDELPPRPVMDAILQLREMMAGGVIQWMAGHSDAAFQQKVAERIDAIEQAEDIPAREAAIIAFYACVYQESGNEMFRILFRSVYHCVVEAARYTAVYADMGEMVQAFRSVLELITVGDSIAALRVWFDWNNPLVEKFVGNLPN